MSRTYRGQHPRYSPKVEEILGQMEKRHDSLLTSAFTVGEVLTGPKKRGHISATEQFREFFRLPQIDVMPSDALHLACAAEAGVDLFLTNDHRLKGLVIPGIHFNSDMNWELV